MCNINYRSHFQDTVEIRRMFDFRWSILLEIYSAFCTMRKSNLDLQLVWPKLTWYMTIPANFL